MHDVVVGARKIAFRTLDLDDAGAGVGEPRRAERRRHRVLQRDDEDALERRRHQKDFGKSSTCVPTCDRIRLVEIGAT